MRRGRHRGSFRHKSARADWVYRAQKYELDSPETQEEQDSGTYYTPIQLSSGEEGATAQVLYDSSQYMGYRFGQEPNAAIGGQLNYALGAEARPDSPVKGPLIHGVEVGLYYFVRSGWVTTAQIFLGLRIIVAQQDQADGRAILEPGYTMWTNSLGIGATTEPAAYANGRQNCWEMRHFRNFKLNDDSQMHGFIHHRFIRVRRRLESHEGLFLYIEAHPSSAPALTGSNFINLWCRTLVSDPNRT